MMEVMMLGKEPFSFDTAIDGLNKIIGVASGAASVGEQVGKTISIVRGTGGTSSGSSETGPASPGSDGKGDDDKKAPIDPMVLYVGGGVAALLVLALVMKKK